MKIDLHHTPAVFDTLAAEWDSLLPSDNALNFFMRVDWQRTWWKHLQRGELTIASVRDDHGALRGVAPCFIATDDAGQRVMHVIGCTDITDYVDWIVARGYEQPVAAALWDFFKSPDAPGWDVIQLCNVPENSPTLQLLPGLAARDGFKAAVAVEDVCPVILLPDSYEAYLESLDKKQRHELKRKRRRAEEYPVAWYVVGPEHNLEQEIDAFLDLMASSTPDKAEFLTQRGHRAFFKEIGPILFARGMLDLSFLSVNDRRVAAMWNFAYGDRMMLYNSGLNSQEFMALSPGIVLLTFNIEHSIADGFARYDFLQGNEGYKYRMGAQTTHVCSLTITR